MPDNNNDLHNRLTVLNQTIGLRENTQPTNPTNLPCDYTIKMYDQLPDGWDGFELQVVINGVPTNYTMTTGSAFDQPFAGVISTTTNRSYCRYFFRKTLRIKPGTTSTKA